MNTQIPIYYGMLWKKSLRILPRFLASLVLTGLILVLGTYIVTKSEGQEQMLPKIPVAIVLEKGDFTSRLAVSMVENTDSVQQLGEFEYLSEEQAEEGLKSGSIQAAIYLPKNVYEDIDSGVNTPIKVQLSFKAVFSTALFRDLIEVGLSMLRTGEATVYSFYDVSGSYRMNVRLSTLMNTVAQNFLTLAMSREDIWRNTTLSPFGTISIENFYLLTALLAVSVLLCGLSFASLYEQDGRVADRCLGRMGIRELHRGMARILPITVILWLLMLLVLIPVDSFTGMVSVTPGLILALLPLAFSEAALIHGIHVWCRGTAGSLVYLLITLLLFLLGGGFLPTGMLPEVLVRLSVILPVHWWQQYGYDVMWNGFSLTSLAGVLGAGIVFAAVGMAGDRWYETRE